MANNSIENKGADTKLEPIKSIDLPDSIKNEPLTKTKGEKGELSSEVAKSLTPEKFVNELEKLKDLDKKNKASALSSCLIQLSYKTIAIEQIISNNEIKLFSPDNSHIRYERALNTALGNGVISMGDFQTAIMYKTSSLDQFVETNIGDKKNGLETTKYVEFLIKKYALNEKGLKDKKGNINVGIITENVTHLGDREFLLAFFTARDSSRNVAFKNYIASNYDKNIQENIKKLNDGLPKETLDKLGIYTGDKLDKLTRNFEKDPMGTMLDVISKDGGMGAILGVIALLFGGGFKGFMGAFVGGTAISNLGLDGAAKLGEKATVLAGETANRVGNGINKLKEAGVDEKYNNAYNKIQENIKGKSYEKEEFIGIFKDLTKSDSFKKIKIEDLKKAKNDKTIGKLFNESNLKIDGKEGGLYYQNNSSKINLFVPELLDLEEEIDKEKTIEDLFLFKKINETPKKETPEIKETPNVTVKTIKDKIKESSNLDDGFIDEIISGISKSTKETIELAIKDDKKLESYLKYLKIDLGKNNLEDIKSLLTTIIEQIPEENKKKLIKNIL